MLPPGSKLHGIVQQVGNDLGQAILLRMDQALGETFFERNLNFRMLVADPAALLYSR